MPERRPRLRVSFAAMLCLLLPGILAGCFSTHSFREIVRTPYPLVEQDDAATRFGNQEDDVAIEVRKAKIDRPVDNLAVHYVTLFPDGEVIRPGDTEEYVKVGDKNAYKVTFRSKYIRKRKRCDESQQLTPAEIAKGWKMTVIRDPHTTKPVQAMYSPVIPTQKILYLVEGTSHVYYVLLRADGDAIKDGQKEFEKFVREGIDYH